MRKDRIGGSDKSSLEGKRRQNTSFPVRPNGIAKSNGDGPDGDDCNHGDEEIWKHTVEKSQMALQNQMAMIATQNLRRWEIEVLVRAVLLL